MAALSASGQRQAPVIATDVRSRRLTGLPAHVEVRRARHHHRSSRTSRRATLPIAAFCYRHAAGSRRSTGNAWSMHLAPEAGSWWRKRLRVVQSCPARRESADASAHTPRPDDPMAVGGDARQLLSVDGSSRDRRTRTLGRRVDAQTTSRLRGAQIRSHKACLATSARSRRRNRHVRTTWKRCDAAFEYSTFCVGTSIFGAWGREPG